MTICCMPNCAYLSETSRMIAVYKELKKMGQNPIMATHGGTYEFLLRDELIDYELVDPYVTHERSLQFASASRSENGIDGFGIYNSAEEMKEFVENEIEFFKKKSVEMVLVGWTLSCAISTRVLNIPLAETHLASMIPPALGKIGIPFLEPYDRYIKKIIPDSLIGAVYHWPMRFNIFMGLFNSVAKSFNIKPFTGFMDLLMGDLTLVTDTPEILGIPEKKLETWKPLNPRLYSRKPKLIYTGALYAQLFGELPVDVREFLDTLKPKIFIALTSSKKDYIEALYEIVKEMNARVLILTTVHEINLIDDENIMVKDHLPSHKIMPLVDLALIHGGQGTTQTAIASATPVIGFPFHGEQSMNIKVIEDAGGGYCLPLSYISKKKKLRRYIEKVLCNESYKQNMKRLKKFQDKYSGAEKAARIIVENVVKNQN